MNKCLNTFYNLTFTILKYTILVMAVLLFTTAFVFTAYINDMSSQTMLLRYNNIFFSLIGIGAFLFLMYFVLHLLRNKTSKTKKYLLFIVCFWYIFAGTILVLFSKSGPAADPRSVYDIAAALAVGNTSVIHPTDSYLSYYPHQLGLVAYYEVVLRIWNLLPIGLVGIHALKLLNICWVCAIIIFQYKTLDLLFRDDKIQIIYLLLMFFNLPLLIYTSFVYGEIPSFACFTIGLWSLLKSFDASVTNTSPKINKAFIIYTILSCIFFIFCIMMRKNALILMIAVIGALIFEILRHKKKILLINLALYICLSCFTLTLVQFHYEQRADNYLSSGVTPLSYFAMGMQEASRGEGWYNGFNFYTYQDSDLNTDLTNLLSKQAITDRMAYFSEHPGEMLQFYANKYLKQWCDGTYASLQATVNDVGGRSNFFVRLYNGDFDSVFIPFCNLMQTILYLGTLAFAVMQINVASKDHLSSYGFLIYIGIIGTFGGLIFHMIWEANSRYIFPYSLLLYPYAAYGLAHFITGVNNRLKTLKP